jgi:subtilase family serine protease
MRLRRVRWWAAASAAGLAVSTVAAAGGIPAAAAASSGARAQLNGSAAPASARTRPAGNVASTSRVSFDLVMSLRDAARAQALMQQVSTPGSALFHHYLSDAQWTASYGPTQAGVTAAQAWLRQQGFSLGAVPADRLFVSASGTAAQVERAFGTTLGNYQVNGHTVRLASTNLSIPTSIAGVVAGVAGVNQYLEQPALAQSAPAAASPAAAQPNQEPAPPAGFVNPQPCSAYWGQKTDTTDAGSLYAPFTSPLPYDICGYAPAQLRGGYGLNSSVASGNNGSGVSLAIVDAYDSPTLLSDAQRYANANDPSYPLSTAQFTNLEPAAVGNEGECAASGWFSEQALDVESSHSMAPGAHIIYVGAQDCLDTSLLAAVNTAITSGASVVTDSWGDVAGDLLEDAASHTAFDDAFMLAATTGVSVLFSTGDEGDNFADFGLAVPNYPPSSPFVTAVGGTTLEVGKNVTRSAEYGWSTGKQVLCTPPATTNCGTATSPTGALAFNAGGGGGTSYFYTQPYYQAGVVPSALALRNEALFGQVPLRVLPDISLDADAQSGMLIGLTQTFPGGVRYGQFKEGGTSLASPLLAGIIADADQAAGSPLGFLNPVLYKADTSHPNAFNDIVPPASPNSTAVIRVDYANTVNVSDGYIVSLRSIDYQGPETFCDGTGNCATRNVILNTKQGFDSMTGIGSVGPQFISVLSKF